jgi:hypothetical protein
MTLRDYFAGQALTGLLAAGATRNLGQSAYAAADLLLMEKRNGN